MKSSSPQMFKRLIVVTRKFPLGSNGQIGDIFGFFFLGIWNKLIFSAILCASKDFIESIEDLACMRMDEVTHSMGIFLLAVTSPAFVMKAFSGGIPPFLSARTVASVFISVLGIFYIAFRHTAPARIFSVTILSYNHALKETTYSQYAAFFPGSIFTVWTIGTILSNLFGGLMYAGLRYYFDNEPTAWLFFLIPAFFEIILYKIIINNPVNISLVIFDRPQESIPDESSVETWEPAGTSDKVKNIKFFWNILLYHGLVVCMSFFNLQGSFENLCLKGITDKDGYRLLYITYCFGNIIGAIVASLLKIKHIWIFIILEICTTSVFLVETFCHIMPHFACTISLALLEGSLISCSYISSLKYLSNKVQHKHSKVLAFNILSLVENLFAIFAGIIIYGLYTVFCGINVC